MSAPAAALGCGTPQHEHASLPSPPSPLLHSNERMRRIERIRWEYGSVLLDAWKQKLSSSEVDYFKGYNEALNKYMRGVGLDLTSDLTPPKHLNVNVRMLEDVGEIMTAAGVPVKLNKDDAVLLRRTDAEQLIRQGKAKHWTD